MTARPGFKRPVAHYLVLVQQNRTIVSSVQTKRKTTMKSTMRSSMCPKCSSSEKVREKMLLIDKPNVEYAKANPNVRAPCTCHGDFSVSDLLPEFVVGGDLQQFVVALYCETCGLGFVPDHMAKEARQAWTLTELGWQRLNPDGSLGPPQRTMSG
jgi:hypothetical protein